MKFLVDAHLPKRLACLLQQLGHDALHTLDLPEQNRTSDESLNRIAVDDMRVIVTKDSDFVDSFLLVRRPPKLLLVSTGNIGNHQLERMFFDNINQIVTGFATNDYIDSTACYLSCMT